MKKIVPIFLLFITFVVISYVEADSSSSNKKNISSSSSTKVMSANLWHGKHVFISYPSPQYGPDNINTDSLTCIDNLEDKLRFKEHCIFETCYNADMSYIVYKTNDKTFDCEEKYTNICERAEDLALKEWLKCIDFGGKEKIGSTCYEYLLWLTDAKDSLAVISAKCGYQKCIDENGMLVNVCINRVNYDCSLDKNTEMCGEAGLAEFQKCIDDF